jgi:hypothetical protein
LFDLRPD